MATPIWSYRVPQEHQGLLRAVADALKSNPDLGQRIEALLCDPASGPVGPFVDAGAAEQFIAGRLVLELRPAEIWIFGSRGRGTHRPNSDYDILVVLDDGTPGVKDYARVHRPIAASGLACDVVPCSVSDFNAAKDQPGTLAYEAAHNGRLLFKRSDRKRRAA